MNYRHAFHAGNFADVFKHALLARVLVYLGQKPAPFRFIDTHAGIGRYDLGSAEATRGGEWRDGIGRLDPSLMPENARALLAPYLDAVGPHDDAGKPLSYPGSPALAQALLRRSDRLIACELHPADAATLKANMGRDARLRLIELDGYLALKAFVPPPERRGVVLIDPPFEARDEFDRMAAGLLEAHRKWPTGTYMAWYPLKSREAVTGFAAKLAGSGLVRVLQLHLTVAPMTDAGPLGGCGLAVVNPPYTLEAEAETLLPFLAQALGRGGPGSWSCRTLVGEDSTNSRVTSSGGASRPVPGTRKSRP